MAQLVQWKDIDLKGYLPLTDNEPEDFLVRPRIKKAFNDLSIVFLD
jgi:hypothetical protein